MSQNVEKTNELIVSYSISYVNRLHTRLVHGYKDTTRLRFMQAFSHHTSITSPSFDSSLRFLSYPLHPYL